MIKALLIEDEKLAMDNLVRHLEKTGEPVSIVGKLESVEESVEWLRQQPLPDLIFMDIHLKDGVSFGIFEKVPVNAPVVFITAYDNFMMQAFDNAGIEYLLKPIQEADLSRALGKYKNLQSHFLQNSGDILQIAAARNPVRRKRILAKRGVEFLSISLDDVAYFFTEQKITFLVTGEGKKYLVDKTLKELVEELDPAAFYRANRKYIIHIRYIKSYKPYDRIKLQVELTTPVAEEVVISQESAADFRKWIAAL
ncbi:MAG TPA: LytTR family DNA-binding domain-containing protein [Sediminibacterium sp.]|nr:LytTR family DNA-binding domain-containing protein [Sediminibacterium sp.]